MKKRTIFLIILFIVCVILFAFVSSYYFFLKDQKESLNVESKTVSSIEDNHSEEIYNECINEPYKMDNLDEKFNELFSKYESYGVSVSMTEINNNYSYYLNENKVYYSASTAKIFMAIYLMEQAREGNIDWDSTCTYLPQDKREASPYTNTHELNSEIKISDLLTYFLSVSDNAAYYILVRVIGCDTLNAYFSEKYNIELNYVSTAPFIYNYTATFANQSLQILYNDLQIDDKYSELVRNAMNNNEENSLNFDNVTFLHKYGEFYTTFHDIGIYDSDNPYLISVLTTLGYQENDSVVTQISKDIYTLYQENLTAKENYCKTKSES